MLPGRSNAGTVETQREVGALRHDGRGPEQERGAQETYKGKVFSRSRAGLRQGSRRRFFVHHFERFGLQITPLRLPSETRPKSEARDQTTMGDLTQGP